MINRPLLLIIAAIVLVVALVQQRSDMGTAALTMFGIALAIERKA